MMRNASKVLPKPNSNVSILSDFDVEIETLKTQCIQFIKDFVPHIFTKSKVKVMG